VSGPGLLLLRECRALAMLNVAGCARVTLQAVAELLAAKPALKLIVPEASYTRDWWKTL
jgi:hypothetical protein